MNQDLIGAAIAQVMPQAIASGLFTGLCTVQKPTLSSGALDGTYTNVAGLVKIPCMDAPEATGGGFSANEQKASSETASLAYRHILLDGFYEDLSPATNWGNIGWRAKVFQPDNDADSDDPDTDSVVYDILGAECDSQARMTRLRVRKVTL